MSNKEDKEATVNVKYQTIFEVPKMPQSLCGPINLSLN